MRGEGLGHARIAEEPGDTGCPTRERGARLGGDPLGAHLGQAVALELLQVEIQRLDERPDVGELLTALRLQERPRHRPEGPLHRCGLGSERGAARRYSARAQHEVPQIDPKLDGREAAHHQRAVGAGQVSVHHEQWRSGWAVDPRLGAGRIRSMRAHVLSRTHELEGTPEEVFPFFADAFNLEAITPRFLDFSVLTPAPILLTTGTVIQYAMRLHGVPITWVSSIQRWDPPHCFVDTQLRGPYRFWHHTHSFEALPGERTLMRDEVRYQLPLPPLGNLAMPFVRRDLEQIFDYRREVLPAELAKFRAASERVMTPAP